MPWQLVHVSPPFFAHFDCSNPWYSYAVNRGVPSAQNRAANAVASPRSDVSRASGRL